MDAARSMVTDFVRFRGDAVRAARRLPLAFASSPLSCRLEL
jgi:hypothetical protein